MRPGMAAHIPPTRAQHRETKVRREPAVARLKIPAAARLPAAGWEAAQPGRSVQASSAHRAGSAAATPAAILSARQQEVTRPTGAAPHSEPSLPTAAPAAAGIAVGSRRLPARPTKARHRLPGHNNLQAPRSPARSNNRSTRPRYPANVPRSAAANHQAQTRRRRSAQNRRVAYAVGSTSGWVDRSGLQSARKRHWRGLTIAPLGIIGSFATRLKLDPRGYVPLGCTTGC